MHSASAAHGLDILLLSYVLSMPIIKAALGQLVFQSQKEMTMEREFPRSNSGRKVVFDSQSQSDEARAFGY